MGSGASIYPTRTPIQEYLHRHVQFFLDYGWVFTSEQVPNSDGPDTDIIRLWCLGNVQAAHQHITAMVSTALSAELKRPYEVSISDEFTRHYLATQLEATYHVDLEPAIGLINLVYRIVSENLWYPEWISDWELRLDWSELRLALPKACQKKWRRYARLLEQMSCEAHYYTTDAGEPELGPSLLSSLFVNVVLKVAMLTTPVSSTCSTPELITEIPILTPIPLRTETRSDEHKSEASTKSELTVVAYSISPPPTDFKPIVDDEKSPYSEIVIQVDQLKRDGSPIENNWEKYNEFINELLSEDDSSFHLTRDLNDDEDVQHHVATTLLAPNSTATVSS